MNIRDKNIKTVLSMIKNRCSIRNVLGYASNLYRSSTYSYVIYLVTALLCTWLVYGTCFPTYSYIVICFDSVFICDVNTSRKVLEALLMIGVVAGFGFSIYHHDYYVASAIVATGAAVGLYLFPYYLIYGLPMKWILFVIGCLLGWFIVKQIVTGGTIESIIALIPLETLKIAATVGVISFVCFLPLLNCSLPYEHSFTNDIHQTSLVSQCNYEDTVFMPSLDRGNMYFENGLEDRAVPWLS